MGKPSTAAAHDERLNTVFAALSDPTRRRIITRLSRGTASVGELAEPFEMSLPAVSKHLSVLERAGLIQRERDGRIQRCQLDARPLEAASEFIERYRIFWESSLDQLAEYLEDSDKDSNSD
jgi:DNA-binding transcriptional ArsR family regulator